MVFTIGKLQKQLKEIKASIHRDRQDILHFKYIEGNCPGAQAPDFDERPIDGEAWEIDIFYQDKIRQVDKLMEAVVEESGPLREVRLFCRWREIELRTYVINLFRSHRSQLC